MEMKFKSYFLSFFDKRYWTLTDDKIIYGKQEIPLSDISKVVETKEDAWGLWLTFWANVDEKRKLFTLSCWRSQQIQFKLAVSHIFENCGEPINYIRKLLERGIDNLEPREKAAVVAYYKDAYEKGEASYLSYIKVKEKCSGIRASAEEIRFAAELEKAKVQKIVDQAKANEATKTIIKDAVIGGVVAGPAGAVVGAIVGKNQADSKK